MQLSFLTLTSLAATALSLPALQPRATEWTIASYTRTCAADDSTCSYSYSINLNDDSAATQCNYSVPAAPPAPASQTSYGVTCGSFVISSGWSDYFGPGNGFTTLAVKVNGNIIYPAYSDAEVVNGTAVTPDKSYAPAAVQQVANVAA
ncbi:hypothetical protein MMC10_003679 [Thelotrema lepadinum]|nr:hypothetical protein [Thelotrema lepadinum]